MKPLRRETSVALFSTALILGACQSAQSQPGRQQAIIETLDISGDGALQFEEVGPLARAVFSKFDLNTNGTFEPPELSAFLKWQRYKAAERRERAKLSVPPRPDPAGASGDQEITEYLEYMEDTLGLDGAVLIVGRKDQIIYQHALGRLEPDTPVPLASASKLFSATVLLAGVERGLIDLQSPLSNYLPEAKNGWERVTLGQLFSLSAGAPLGHAMNYDPRDAPSILIESLMEEHMAAEPNTVFQYTGTGMQVAGFALSKAAGKTWQELVDTWIAKPTGMSEVVYGHPTWRDDSAQINTPNIGGGLRASASDYFKLLRLISNRGQIQGSEVLAAQSVDKLFIDRTSKLETGNFPAAVPASWSYSLGAWCESRSDDGECGRISSTGAYGTYPWIDREKDLHGILVTVDRNAQIMPYSLELRRRTEAVFSTQTDALKDASE